MSQSTNIDLPTLNAIRQTHKQIQPYIIHTPTIPFHSLTMADECGPGTQLFLKLELLQRTGTFKPRGALAVMLGLDGAARARGVTAVSAGNHAIGVAYAAAAVGTSAKVVMLSHASPIRVDLCRRFGAEVVLIENVHEAFERANEIAAAEGRTFVHPFEGPLTALGTATVGLELCEDIADLDAVVVPVGGGGLIAGIAAAVKLAQPDCAVYGVEPFGADSMYRSIQAGEPRSIDTVETIADSLGAPFALPYSFGLVQTYVDDVIRIDDNALRASMRLLYDEAKLAVEPAGAAATAAVRGPLRDRLRDKRVGLIICGSNIDFETYRTVIGSSS